MWLDFGTRETWNFINGFAGWLAALGTFAAVVVSLYLATRDWRVRLKVNAGIRKIVAMGQRIKDSPQFVSITVTNVGRRGAKITSLYWKTGILRKQSFVQFSSDSPLSAKLPTKLGDGDDADFLFPLGAFKENIEEFKKAGSFRFPRIASRFIKVGVLTSTGKQFESRIEKEFQRWFVEQIATNQKP